MRGDAPGDEILRRGVVPAGALENVVHAAVRDGASDVVPAARGRDVVRREMNQRGEVRVAREGPRRARTQQQPGGEGVGVIDVVPSLDPVSQTTADSAPFQPKEEMERDDVVAYKKLGWEVEKKRSKHIDCPEPFCLEEPTMVPGTSQQDF